MNTETVTDTVTETTPAATPEVAAVVSTETKNQAGRPTAKLKYPNGSFTVKDLHKLNPTVIELTIRNHINAGLKSKFLTRMERTRPSGKRPSYLYIQTKRYQASLANLAKSKKTVDTSTPIPVEVASVVAETSMVVA